MRIVLSGRRSSFASTVSTDSDVSDTESSTHADLEYSSESDSDTASTPTVGLAPSHSMSDFNAVAAAASTKQTQKAKMLKLYFFARCDREKEAWFHRQAALLGAS